MDLCRNQTTILLTRIITFCIMKRSIMNEMQLKLCDIQGRLFELSAEKEIGSAGFVKRYDLLDRVSL